MLKDLKKSRSPIVLAIKNPIESSLTFGKVILVEKIFIEKFSITDLVFFTSTYINKK